MESPTSPPDPSVETPASQRKQPPPISHSSLDQNSPILPHPLPYGLIFHLGSVFSGFKLELKLALLRAKSQSETRSHSSSSLHSASSVRNHSDSIMELNAPFPNALSPSTVTDTTHRCLNQILADEYHSNEAWQFGTFPGSNVVAGTEDDQNIISRWTKLMEKNIKTDETFKERFKMLKLKRYLKNGVAKTTHTQPFVNGILRAFFKIYLQEHHPQDHVTEYSSNSSLYLFCEQKVDDDDRTEPTEGEDRFLVKTRTEEVPRIPDAAFFRRGTPVGSEGVIFDSAALSCGLVNVEAKKNLCKQNIKDAISQCQRDHAHASDKYPSNRMRVGFSIITDGVDWYFLYIKWEHCRFREWKQSIHASKKIEFERNNTELAKWLLFILQLSLTEPKLPTKLVQAEIGGLSLTGLLQCGSRSNVSVWENGDGEYFVLKLFYDLFEVDNMKYCRREFDFLSAIARGHDQNIVKLLNHDKEKIDTDGGFWLNYGGTPLQYLDICGKRGQQLAVIVKRDIWDGALATLKAHKICHGDIHEKNVLVCLKSNKATLIDFESATKFENNIEDSPVRHDFYQYEEAQEEIDKISVAALLWFLWDPLKTDFDGLEDFMEFLKEKIDQSENCDIVLDRITDAVTRNHDHGAKNDEANDEGSTDEDDSSRMRME